MRPDRHLTLEAAAGEAPVAKADGFRFTLARAAFAEGYEMRRDGLEQTFTFARRPAAAGDLVVTGKGDVFVTDSFRPMLWHVTAAQVAAGTGTPQGLDVSVSITFTALFIVAAVALSSAAAMPTSATATSACSSADANDRTTPRRQVSSLATRYDEITALPCPGPAAWNTP